MNEISAETTEVMSLKHRILVVEDEQAERDALARILRMADFEPVTAGSVEAALARIQEQIDVVISDLRLGTGPNGVALLRAWRKQHPTAPFMLLTAFGDVESAVDAMKLGADEYLTKPVDPDELLTRIRRCLDQRSQLHAPVEGFEEIVARSEAMQDVFGQTYRAAQTDSTVLIIGESGTGKELIAHALHQNSQRSAAPFITVNMAAIPETLVESELFGHIRGSFTGAAADRVGRFQAASGGTLFIDEIGDFQLASQAKLLRALENSTVTPVGSNQEEHVDVRVVAATSRELHEMLRDGTFREDLFYRLNVVTIALPPLRDRRDDIGLLARSFLAEFCEQQGRSLLQIDPGLMQFLESFDWPGNVRQLRNCIESMVVMAQRDVLTLEDLPNHLEPPLGDDTDLHVPRDTTLDELEREAIRQTLDRFQGNRTQTAESLGISVRTLQRRIKEWNMEEE
ncbi:MAG: sigma-54 dependent transcriptional regulator [Fuerstiella sp.]